MLHTDSLLHWRNDGGAEVQQPCYVRFSDDLQQMVIDYKVEEEQWLYCGQLKSEGTYEMHCEGPNYRCDGTLTLKEDKLFEGSWMQEQNGVKSKGSWSLDVA